MTDPTRREIATRLDALDEDEEFTLADYLWADLKDYHGGRLTPQERRLLADPEAHLPPSAVRRLGTGPTTSGP